MTAQAPLHGAVVLAAGGSTRLGRSKQLLRRGGEALVHRAARLALSTQPLDAIVIVGAAGERVRAAVADLPIRCVEAADWRRGIGASLHVGVAALDVRCAGVLVLVCDQPTLDADHLGRLCRAWHAAPDRASASAYAGTLGVPALLPRRWFAQLAADAGAGSLLRERQAEVTGVPDEALAWDVDQEGDLDATFDEE